MVTSFPLVHFSEYLPYQIYVLSHLSRSEEAGRDAYARYSHLVSQQNLPFVRASSAERTVDSATNWTLGAH